MLVIKNILRKIKVNYLFVLLSLVCFLTGLYKEFLAFTSIIVIHEIGHIISSSILKWKIKKIEINIYGGNIKYEEYINRPLIEELIVAVSGIIIQSLYFLFIFAIFKKGTIDNRLFTMIANYHYSIIIFNILPIPPLDGYKIFSIITNTIISYKKSLNLCPIFSSFILFVLIILVYISNIKGNSFLILGLLTIKLIEEYKNKNHLFNKFLLERYLYNINFKRIKKINKGLNSMYKDYNHIFYINGKEITEKKMIKNHFINVNSIGKCLK